MAGHATIDYRPGSWVIKLFGGDDKLVDIYEVGGDKLELTPEAKYELLKRLS